MDNVTEYIHVVCILHYNRIVTILYITFEFTICKHCLLANFITFTYVHVHLVYVVVLVHIYIYIACNTPHVVLVHIHVTSKIFTCT